MKKILIIGATSTIAIACARLWADQGAGFFLVGRCPEKLDAVASDLAVRGALVVHTATLDVSDLAAHSRTVEAGIELLGGCEVALIAHGTLPNQAACEQDAQLAAREFTTNATSTIALLTVLATYFEREGEGSIAVITSVAGDRGRSTNYVYGSAKASVSTFCDGLRARLFTAGVSVTDIRPGFVATPMTEGLNMPAFLVSRPSAVAKRIVAGIASRESVLYVPAYWILIMAIVRNIPASIFNRMKL